MTAGQTSREQYMLLVANSAFEENGVKGHSSATEVVDEDGVVEDWNVVEDVDVDCGVVKVVDVEVALLVVNVEEELVVVEVVVEKVEGNVVEVEGSWKQYDT